MLASLVFGAAGLVADQTIMLQNDHQVTRPLSKSSEKLIISSTTGNSLVVKKGTSWDLRKEAKEIEIAGNACLIIEPGAKIIGNGGVLRFKDTSRCIMKGNKQ
jgi:hypothetical protein